MIGKSTVSNENSMKTEVLTGIVIDKSSKESCTGIVFLCLDVENQFKLDPKNLGGKKKYISFSLVFHKQGKRIEIDFINVHERLLGQR